MKWTLAQLKKMYHQDPTFERTVDVSAYMADDPDLITVSDAFVEGEIDIEDDTFYHFDLHIKATLTVACARSLEPVPLNLDFFVTETFSEEEKDPNRRPDGLTIDLLPIIWSNIYLEKPMRVIHPDWVDDDSFESSEEHERKKEHGRPELAELEKYKS